LWRSYRAEELASPAAFRSDPDTVWQWYEFRRDIVRKAEPNPAHRALAELEDSVEEFTLITQNVDNLHRRAGSVKLLELHGNIEKNYCSACRRRFDRPFPENQEQVPRCSCGAPIRPDIVWFGENLPLQIWQQSVEAARSAGLFLCIGTSSLVYPAASLPWAAMDRHAVIIEVNPDSTDLSSRADLHIPEKAGSCLPALVDELLNTLNETPEHFT